MAKIKAYLGLGGNEGNVLLRLQQALALLAKELAIASLEVSHFYYTAPLEVDSFHWFLNAVCSFETEMDPIAIFAMTQTIENQLGKVPKPKHASRPIDIDFLFYGNHLFEEGGLEIPHPRWKERLFVLVPLADLTSEILLQREGFIERHVLYELIQFLRLQSSQTIFRAKVKDFYLC